MLQKSKVNSRALSLLLNKVFNFMNIKCFIWFTDDLFKTYFIDHDWRVRKRNHICKYNPCLVSNKIAS